MDTFLHNWLLLVGVFSLGLASPGPDFVMAVRNALVYSRKAGIYTAFGFAGGVAVHVGYCLAGLALVISQPILLFSALKYLGAAYLFYIGFQALRSNGLQPQSAEASAGTLHMSPFAAFRSGFVTNLFNPKATMFFLALFTQLIDPSIGFAQKAVYGMTCIVMTAVWFSLVATVLTTPRIRAAYVRVSKWIDRACGAVLIALGLRLALSRA